MAKHGSGFWYNFLYDIFDRIPLIRSEVEHSDQMDSNWMDGYDDYENGRDNAHNNRHDPIIFDLNGDGIKTTTIDNGTFFDYGNDGFKEATAWVDSNDGILVVDSNSSGTIDNESELVTNLSIYDSNNDGIVDSNDTNFSSLKILKNDNTLETLTESGIASINLTTTTTGTNDSNGNTQVWSGTYTKTDNTTAAFGDYELETDKAYSMATERLIETNEVAVLPDAEGHGTVYTLHQAMLRNSNLTTLVQNFVSATSDSTRWTLVNEILAEWTGSENVSTTSRGPYVNAQHLAIVEAFMGEGFVQAYTESSNPTQEAGDFLEQAYISFGTYVYAELMAQTTLADLFNEVTYNSETKTFDLSAVITSLQTAITANSITGKELVVEFATALKGLGLDTSSNYQSLTDSSDFYNTFTANDRDLKWQLDTIGKSYDANDLTGEGTAKDDAMRITSSAGGSIHSLEGNDVTYGGDGNDWLGICSGDDLADAGGGNDLVLACDGNDTVYGAAGNDTIYGAAGNDILIGGTGNDYLDGGADDDTYVFNLGDGNDTITDIYGTDKILFGEGISAEDLTITTSGNNKVITYGTQGDSITIIGQINSNVINNIAFSDGTAYDFSNGNLEYIVNGTDGNDSLVSDTSYGTIYGEEGNDTIYYLDNYRYRKVA